MVAELETFRKPPWFANGDPPQLGQDPELVRAWLSLVSIVPRERANQMTRGRFGNPQTGWRFVLIPVKTRRGSRYRLQAA